LDEKEAFKVAFEQAYKENAKVFEKGKPSEEEEE